MKRAAPFSDSDCTKGISFSRGTSNSPAPSATLMPTNERVAKALFHNNCVPWVQLNRIAVQSASVFAELSVLVNEEKAVRRHSADSATPTGPAQVLNGWPETLK